MKIYSFIAECLDDVNDFAKNKEHLGILFTYNVGTFDSLCIFQSDMEIDVILQLLREQDDSHAMIRTLKQLI